MEEKLNKNQEAYQKELEDELASLEAQLSDEDQHDNNSDDQDENISLNELEKQIQEMSGEEDNNKAQQSEPKKPQKKYPFAVPLNKLQIIEKNFHGFELFFGEALEIEIEKIIPNFKEKLQDEDDAIDFLLFLEQKKGKLVLMQKAVEQKVQNQQMNPLEYLKCLKGFLNKNMQILKVIQSKKVGAFDLARVQKRIKIFQDEIKNVQEAIKNQEQEQDQNQEQNQENISEENTEKNIENEQENLQEKKQENQNENQNDEQKNFFKSEQKNDQQSQIKTEKELQSNEVYVYLKSKKNLFVALLDYFIKHMSEERKNDIEKYQKILKEIDNYLKDFAEGKLVVLTKKEIDVKFPNPKKDFVVGMSQQQKQQKIQKIAQTIKNDLTSLKRSNPKLFQSITKYYQNFFANLKKVQESDIPFPIIKKEQVPINCRILNKELDRGQIAINFLNIKSPKPTRVFFLRFWIQYKGVEQGFETNYCQQGGKMNYRKVIDLDSLGLRDKYLKKAILILHIFKRKYVAFHRHICRREMTLESIIDYATKKYTVSFDYKNGQTLDVDFQISMRKAVSQTPKIDIELFKFVKTFPEFQIQQYRRISSIQNTENVPNVQQKKRQSSLNKKNIDTSKLQKEIALEKKITQQLKPENSQINKFLFPLLSEQEYNLLKVVVAKCKLNHAYLDYDTKIFCVSFLESYKKDLEKQIKFYNENLDMDMMKKANEKLIKADQYLNYLETNIEQEKMSIEQYKQMIQGFLKMDEQLKKVFEKMKQIKGIQFVSNRISLIKKELEDFDKISNEQLKKINYLLIIYKNKKYQNIYQLQKLKKIKMFFQLLKNIVYQ